MKYLITGITGFVGPHLAQLLLKEGHEVTGLIRATSGRETDLLDILSPSEINNIRKRYADLTHAEKIAEIIRDDQYDGVFHLAAQSHPGISFDDPVMTFQYNVMGSVNLITAIERYSPHTKMAFISTSEVYGDQCRDTGMLYESDHLKPSNPYGVSKAAIDLYMQERMANGKITGFITRAFSHSGPRRFKNFSISSDAYQLALMAKGKIEGPLYIGNLQTERVVIDVRDCVRAYYLLMEYCHTDMPGSNGHVFNICGDTVHKMEYFTDLLIKASGLKDVEKKIKSEFYRDIDIQVQIGDSQKLRQLTGWEPEIPIEKTMEDLLNYWLNKL